MFEVTATIVLESPLPLTATDKESPKRPWFLYALSLGVCVCAWQCSEPSGHFTTPWKEKGGSQGREREKAHSPLRRACSTPVSTVSWKIGHDMIFYKIQRYHFWDHFLGLFSGAIFWEHFLGPFSGMTIFWDHLRDHLWDDLLGPFMGRSSETCYGTVYGTIFWDHLLGSFMGWFCVFLFKWTIYFMYCF